jgi:hypothetical protein
VCTGVWRVLTLIKSRNCNAHDEDSVYNCRVPVLLRDNAAFDNQSIDHTLQLFDQSIAFLDFGLVAETFGFVNCVLTFLLL